MAASETMTVVSDAVPATRDVDPAGLSYVHRVFPGQVEASDVGRCFGDGDDVRYGQNGIGWEIEVTEG